MEQRVAKNEHTMNIVSRSCSFKDHTVCIWMSTITLDIVVDTLRNIKHFGATEYVSITVEILLEKAHPCNIDTIDAVTTRKWAESVCY
jgi:hypothetical protein